MYSKLVDRGKRNSNKESIHFTSGNNHEFYLLMERHKCIDLPEGLGTLTNHCIRSLAIPHSHRSFD